jgi:hypothetical protein
VITSGLAATASAMSSVPAAPRDTSGGTRSAVRFQTVVGCPAAMNAVATARPIEPSPRTVTGVRSVEIMSVILGRHLQKIKY